MSVVKFSPKLIYVAFSCDLINSVQSICHVVNSLQVQHIHNLSFCHMLSNKVSFLLISWIVLKLHTGNWTSCFYQTEATFCRSSIILYGSSVKAKVLVLLYYFVTRHYFLERRVVSFIVHVFYLVYLCCFWSRFVSVCCIYRDAIVINFVSFGTSLYAGIAVFSIIGFMAHEQHVPIEKVINSGM